MFLGLLCVSSMCKALCGVSAGAANSAIGAAAADAGDDTAPDNSGGGDRAGGPGSEDQNKPLVGSRTPGLREVRYELVSAERLLDHAHLPRPQRRRGQRIICEEGRRHPAEMGAILAPRPTNEPA